MTGWLVVAIIAVGFIALAICYCQWREREDRRAFEASLSPYERHGFKAYASNWRDYIPLVAAERERSIMAALNAARDARARRDLQLS